MKPFKPSDYYYIGKESSILDDRHNVIVQMTARGMELAAEYYKTKYQSIITIAQIKLPKSSGASAQRSPHFHRKDMIEYFAHETSPTFKP